jgi:hypothetical protein
MSGNGNPPMAAAVHPELALIIGGSFFFTILVMVMIRIFFPRFFKRWFQIMDAIFGAIGRTLLVPDFGTPMLAKEVAQLKNELLQIQRSIVANDVGSSRHGNILEVPPAIAIDAAIAARLRSDAESMNLSQLLEIKSKLSYATQQQEARSDLEGAMDQELGSARTIKKIMLNFFITFNFLLIISLAYLNNFTQKDLSASAYQGITALYVSLAVFIVYVYRTTNSRILIILASKEDAKRLFDAERYLNNRPKSVTSERDVEVLKMLLTNRMERERGAEHPYELVLKGITNSNVLVKGGKVTSAATK